MFKSCRSGKKEQGAESSASGHLQTDTKEELKHEEPCVRSGGELKLHANLRPQKNKTVLSTCGVDLQNEKLRFREQSIGRKTKKKVQ